MESSRKTATSPTPTTASATAYHPTPQGTKKEYADQYAEEQSKEFDQTLEQREPQHSHQPQHPEPQPELQQPHHCPTIEDREREHFSPAAFKDATVHNNDFLSCCLPGASRQAMEHLFEDKKLAVIMLHERMGPCFRAIWKAADVRICCDGSGELMWHEHGEPQREIEMHPHALVGDVEAMKKTHVQALEQFGTRIAPIRNYQLTDLEKALTFLQDHQGDAALRGLHISHVIVYGGLDGRLDKVLSRFHALHEFASSFRRIVLLSDHGMAEMLMPGKHVIRCNPQLEPIGMSCGLFPLGHPCREVTTMGLQWNLDKATLEFGCKVSAANTIVSHCVKVICSDPLLWTVTFRSPCPEASQASHATSSSSRDPHRPQ